MKILKALIKRNLKLFFKDKGMFFAALITPVILLFIYIFFLSDVYKEVLVASLPQGFVVSSRITNGYVGGHLVSSLLSVSCVTVSVCTNMLMVQDKANSSIKDITMSSVKLSVLAQGYYYSAFICSLIICFSAATICLIYLGIVGFYMTFMDVALLFLCIILLTMFGTAISSVINFFLKTQGQISAVGSIISSGYGFVCGAYMPLSQFSVGIRNVFSILPGTFGTSLIRNVTMRGVFEEMNNLGLPKENLEVLKDSIDCNLYGFGNRINLNVMLGALVISIVFLVSIYIALNLRKIRKSRY